MGGDCGNGLECGYRGDKEKIVQTVKFFKMGDFLPELYGDGRAAE